MSDEENRPEVEILDPDGGDQQVDPNNFIALISNYTNRPDLLIAELEKHDSGFIKRMNKATEERAQESETARFKFGRTQAYAGLGLSIAAAISLLVFLFVAALLGQLSFWVIIGVAFFYAVTQGGSLGFSRVIDAIAGMVSRDNEPPGN